MDYESVEQIENGILLSNVKNFELKHIFECGQCFRWNKTQNGSYIGVAFNRVIEVQKQGEDVIIYNTDMKDFNLIWKEYFDLSTDYALIKESLKEDPLLNKAIDFGYGIRILNQECFEMIISFITSANNRIPMIKKCIENMSRMWGKPIEYNGKTYYGFPEVSKIAQASISELESTGTGFRAKYIKDTAERIYENNNIDYIRSLNDDECHNELMKFNGIGPKVADCIMLFSMQKHSAFPVDVWVKRAMIHFYLAPDVSLNKIRDFGRKKFNNLSGFAQQYLFYYARENNIKLD
jgi:N-glycosylase/DNA lyase